VIHEGDTHQHNEYTAACLSGGDDLYRRHASCEYRHDADYQHEGLVTEKRWCPDPEWRWLNHKRSYGWRISTALLKSLTEPDNCELRDSVVS